MRKAPITQRNLTCITVRNVIANGCIRESFKAKVLVCPLHNVAFGLTNVRHASVTLASVFIFLVAARRQISSIEVQLEYGHESLL